MNKFLKEFKERGFFYQCTNEEDLSKLLNSKKIKAYIGFDCTAESLHVGSLLQIMCLRLLQKHGHKPIVLLGGGTTRIGDPSGKDQTRKILNKNEIPKHIISELGKPGSTWINSLVSGVFKASSDGSVKMDEEVLNIMNDLRKFMFEKVYLRDETKKEREEAKKVVEKLVLNFAYNPDLLPRQYRTSQSEIENAVDYVAGMTDRFALKEFEKL